MWKDRPIDADRVVPDDVNWSWGGCDARPKCKNPANSGWHIEGVGFNILILCDEHNNHETAVSEFRRRGWNIVDKVS